MRLNPARRPEQVGTSADCLESPAAVAKNLNLGIANQKAKRIDFP
jgi:hypothetical protein